MSKTAGKPKSRTIFSHLHRTAGRIQKAFIFIVLVQTLNYSTGSDVPHDAIQTINLRSKCFSRKINIHFTGWLISCQKLFAFAPCIVASKFNLTNWICLVTHQHNHNLKTGYIRYERMIPPNCEKEVTKFHRKFYLQNWVRIMNDR